MITILNPKHYWFMHILPCLLRNSLSLAEKDKWFLATVGGNFSHFLHLPGQPIDFSRRMRFQARIVMFSISQNFSNLLDHLVQSTFRSGKLISSILSSASAVRPISTVDRVALLRNPRYKQSRMSGWQWLSTWLPFQASGTVSPEALLLRTKLMIQYADHILRQSEASDAHLTRLFVIGGINADSCSPQRLRRPQNVYWY